MFCTVCTITLCYVIYILYCACAQVKNGSDYHIVCWAETRGESSLIFSEDTTMMIPKPELYTKHGSYVPPSMYYK